MPGIPFSTTAITVTRVPEDETRDGYDPTPPPVTVATAVRAVIPPPSPSDQLAGGERVDYNSTMRCDPCDIQQDDTVLDGQGNQWRVLNVTPVSAFFLDFLNVSLRRVTGASTA